MKTVSNIFAKWVVSYLAVIFTIILMPAFLITKDVSAFESVINYLFNNNS